MTYTLAFDVYGTLIDTSGVFDSLEQILGEKATVVMNTWRAKQLEYSFRRGIMKSYIDFSIVTKEALEYACQANTVQLSDSQKETLLNEYTVLPIFQDVLSGLQELKRSGHRLYAFSNGSEKAILKLLDNAKILDFFQGVVSVEETQTFKPNPKVYEYFNQRANTTKTDSWLISSNPFDVLGAMSYGMRSAWVQRSPDAVFDPWGMQPTTIISKLTELPYKLKGAEN